MIGKPSGRHKVLCLGRTYCDIILTGLHDMPALGRERFAEDVTIVAGGVPISQQLILHPWAGQPLC